MNNTALKRYEYEIVKMNKAGNEDKLFLSGVVSGIRTSLLLCCDMTFDEYNELVELADSGMLRRPCEICPDKTFDNYEGQRVSCSHTGYEVHFAGDFAGDYRNWWNEYVDANGEIYYGR